MKSLMKFEHVDASTLDEAVAVLKRFGDKAWVMAGGSDLIGTMRFEVLQDYPAILVNLKSIPGLEYIKEEDNTLKIGALTKLEDVAINPIIRSKYTALAEAAGRTASPHVRAMGTIAGNICQLIRCWYFRKEDNRFDCIRKGGAMCHAVVGDNRYHSIFGAVRVADPPCVVNCPAGNEIPSYLSSIRDDNLEEAGHIILGTNLMPAVTGRVCPHTCELKCNRSELDESISIRSIERHVGDYILENSPLFFAPPVKEVNKKIAIVGSGPAGLATAYYLRTLGYKVTVFEAREEAGGVLIYGIPPYRLPKDIVRKQIQAIQKTGVEFKLKVDVGKDLSLDDLQKEFDAVFCDTGAWKPSRLGIADEDLLMQGLDFLNQVNRGIKNVQGRRILVIGGGSVAMDVATSAKRLGAAEVTLACLESRSEMPALADEVDLAEKEGIRLLPSWGPSLVLKKEGKVRGMELIKCTSVYNSEHRFAPVYDRSTTQTVEADQIILAIGQRPELSYAEKALKIERGLIVVNPETQDTGVPKIFAGGDATVSGPLSVVSALASGRRAAIAINSLLGGPDTLRVERKIEHLTRNENSCLQTLPRVKIPEKPLNQLSFESEDTDGLVKDAVASEAGRCLNCGCDGVNPSDIAPALVALDARIITTRRTIKAEDFWVADTGLKPTILDNDEIITEIQIPQPAPGVRSSFIKFAMRKSIDFPIVNCASAVETRNGVVESVRVCLNAVHSNPYRAVKAETAIAGKTLDEDNAEAAGAEAVSDAIPLSYNKFKIQIAKTLVKRTLLACAPQQ